MLFHSCTSASRSSCSVSGGFWRHVTSLVFVKTFWTRMRFWFRKSWQTRGTWHLALSCWKTWLKCRCCRKGRTIESRISIVYFTAFWGHQNSPTTLQELRDALVHEWNNIPEAFIKRLIGSIRRRCEAVVAARGGHTRYWTPQTSDHDGPCNFLS
jgi:hypothetical protein